MTQTISKALTDSWDLVADGATVARIGLQSASSFNADIAIATSLPPANTPDFITLPANGFSEDIAAADKVYARASGGRTKSFVRGYTVAR